MRRALTLVLVLQFLPALQAGEPWARHAIDASSHGADGVRLQDVNGDGLPDIATGWEEGWVVRAYVNPGPAQSKSPWPAVTVGKVRAAEDAVFADLDGDGAVDVVSSCEGSIKTVFAHWAPRDPAKYLDPAAWTTEPFPATQGKVQWMYCLPLDVDGQNGIDLIVGSKNAGAAVGWLQSPADPRDLAGWKYRPLYDAGWIMSLMAHDMDADGDLDVLLSDRKGDTRGVLWLENPGAKANVTGADWKEHRLSDSNHGYMFLTLADLDKDGRMDVVCITSDEGVIWYRATGDAKAPWAQTMIPLPANCGTGKGVAVCDVDGDGRQDILFTCENATGEKSGARWLSYRNSPSDPVWDDHEISGPEGTKFDRIELLDLDGDGDLDLITCEERAQLGVIWYENPSRAGSAK